LPNCWRTIFLVLPNLDGCQVDLPNLDEADTFRSWPTRPNIFFILWIFSWTRDVTDYVMKSLGFFSISSFFYATFIYGVQDKRLTTTTIWRSIIGGIP
jgi:hypothetical protein